MAEELLFPEMEAQSVTDSEVERKPEIDPFLSEFEELAGRKGVVQAVKDFSLLSSGSEDNKFSSKAEDAGKDLKESAKIVYPDRDQENKRLISFLKLARETSLFYALYWAQKECTAMFVSTNEDESPYRVNRAA